MEPSSSLRDRVVIPKGEWNKVIQKKLRDNALRETEFFDISQKSGLLPDLKTDFVCPRLVVPGFYQETKFRKYDYNPMSSWWSHPKAKSRRGVSLNELFENFKQGQLSFVGQAGSGKTTLLKAITRQIIDGDHVGLKNIELIHFVHLRSFKRNDLVTPAELLFQDVDPTMSNTEMEEAYRYAKQNPEKVLFVIDSLDTIPYNIDGVYSEIEIDTNARSSPEYILYHLLAGNLLPGCRFITSSREFAIRNYRGNVQANKVVALSGLTKDSMKKIVVGYLGKDGAERVMTYLKEKPIIESLCSMPLWLIFTLMALNTKPEFQPTTMSGILVTVLQSMIRSQHTQVQNIESAIEKLAHMAFTGTMERRVDFLCEELPTFGLTLEEIADLMVVTPSGKYQRLIFGDSILFFSHQSIQEIFTAFHITKLPLQEYKDVIQKKIHQAPFAVVRRLLCGIMLDSEVSREAENFIADMHDLEEKKAFLKESISEQLRSCMRRHLYGKKNIPYELYISLREASDGVNDILKNKIDIFDLGEKAISLSEMYCILWVMNHQQVIKHLRLGNNSLTSSLSIALEQISIEFQLNELHICGPALGSSALEVFGQALVKLRPIVLKFNGCTVESGAAKSFSPQSTSCPKLNEFEAIFSPETELGSDEMELIAKISGQCKPGKLRLEGSRLHPGGLQSFPLDFGGVKLDEFEANFSSNTKLGPDEMEMITKISTQCKPSKMSFTTRCISLKFDNFQLEFEHDAELGPDEMKMFAELIHQYKPSKLALKASALLPGALESFLFHSVGVKLDEFEATFSSDRKLSLDEMKLITKISSQCKPSKMIFIWKYPEWIFGRCSSLKIDNFQLEFKHDAELGPDEMKMVAELLHQYKPSKLALKAYALLPGALESFLFHSVGVKLDKFELAFSDRVELGPHHMEIIAEISHQCKPNKLSLKRFILNPGALESFLQRSVGVKISKLRFELSSWSPKYLDAFGRILRQCGVETLLLGEDWRRINVEDFKICDGNYFKLNRLAISDLVIDINSIIKLIPYVVDKIDIASVCKLSNIDLLQNQLNSSGNKNLRIAPYSVKIFQRTERELINQMQRDESDVPCSVRDRRAEWSDGIIIVSWTYSNEGPSLRYHIQTFCNERKAGDVVICTSKSFEYKTLLPWKLYCFKIWVVNSSGVAGDAMFTNEVATRQLAVPSDVAQGLERCQMPYSGSQQGQSLCQEQATPSHAFLQEEAAQQATLEQIKRDLDVRVKAKAEIAQTIGSEGGEISLFGSSLSFLPESLNNEKEITLSVDNNPENYPPNLKAVTTILGVKPSMKFEKPVTVTMRTWYSAMEGESIPLVLSSRKHGAEWKKIGEVMLGSKNEVEFTVYHFCKITLGLPKSPLRFLNHHLFIDPYIQRQTAMIDLVCTRDPKTQRDFRNTLKEKSCASFSTKTLEVEAKPDQKVSLHVHISDPENKEFQKPVKVDKLEKSGYYHVQCDPDLQFEPKHEFIRGKGFAFVDSKEEDDVILKREWPITLDPPAPPVTTNAIGIQASSGAQVHAPGASFTVEAVDILSASSSHVLPLPTRMNLTKKNS